MVSDRGEIVASETKGNFLLFKHPERGGTIHASTLFIQPLSGYGGRLESELSPVSCAMGSNFAVAMGAELFVVSSTMTSYSLPYPASAICTDNQGGVYTFHPETESILKTVIALPNAPDPTTPRVWPQDGISLPCVSAMCIETNTQHLFVSTATGLFPLINVYTLSGELVHVCKSPLVGMFNRSMCFDTTRATPRLIAAGHGYTFGGGGESFRGGQIATYDWTDDNQLQLVKTGTEWIHTVDDHICKVAFHPSGRLLLMTYLPFTYFIEIDTSTPSRSAFMCAVLLGRKT